jgi:hypothetical protein
MILISAGLSWIRAVDDLVSLGFVLLMTLISAGLADH